MGTEKKHGNSFFAPIDIRESVALCVWVVSSWRRVDVRLSVSLVLNQPLACR